ncbi:hypothetical protein [Endothiovibrio diazotrophicus]
MGRIIGWLPLVWLLIGCQSTVVRQEERWFRPAVGTVVELVKPLEVAVGDARIFLQHGTPVTWGGVRQLEPHCNFEVRDLAESVQTIRPDTFTITRVRWGFEEVVDLGPRVVASAAVLAQVNDDGLPMISRYVQLRLESAAQPNVMRLTCHGAFDDLPEAEEPTPAEIADALGGWARIAGLSPQGE